MAWITLAWKYLGDCPLCEKPMKVGDEVIKPPNGGMGFRHGTCYQADMKKRQAIKVTYGMGLKKLIEQVPTPGTIRLSAKEARAVINAVMLLIPDIEPVSKPDIHDRSQRWFGKISGWSRERVCGDCMTLNEIVGFWIDHLNAMRSVPFRKVAVVELLARLEQRIGKPLVYADAFVKEADEDSIPLTWTDEELEELVAATHGRKTLRTVEVKDGML